MKWLIFIFLCCISQIQCENATAENSFTNTSTELASVRVYPSQLHLCTATFISTKYLITTARCLACYPSCDLFLRAEMSRLGCLTEGTNLFIKTVYTHPDFKMQPPQYNFGVIELRDEFDNAKVFDVPNFQATMDMKGKVFTWRFSYDRNDFALFFNNVTTISNAKCSLILGDFVDCDEICPMKNNNSLFELGPYDQGTPVTLQHNGKWYLSGIYTRMGPLREVTTEVYESLTPLADWIESITNGNSTTTGNPTLAPGPASTEGSLKHPNRPAKRSRHRL